MLQFGHAASAVQGGLVSDIGGLGGVDAGDVKTATGGRSELELAQSTHRGTRNSHVDSIGMSAVGRKKKKIEEVDCKRANIGGMLNAAWLGCC